MSFHLNSCAYHNRWTRRHPAEKAVLTLGFLLLAVSLSPLPWSLVILVLMSTLALLGAGLPPRTWLTFLAVPGSFSLLTSLALVMQVEWVNGGMDMRLSRARLPLAIGLALRSVTSVSCVALLGLTTPMPELLRGLRRLGVPAALVMIAFHTYRFIFVVMGTLAQMSQAQQWRMGRATWRVRFQAVVLLSGSFLVRCLERARKQDEGMESRGLVGELLLLSDDAGISWGFLLLSLCGQVTLAAAAWWYRNSL